MKYQIHIEADFTLEFEPWDGCLPDEYAEQIGNDMVSVPEYAKDQVKASDVYVSVDTRREEQ